MRKKAAARKPAKTAARKPANAAARKPAKGASRNAGNASLRKAARRVAAPAAKRAPPRAPKANPAARRVKNSDLPTVDGLTTLVLAKSDVVDGKLRLRTKAPPRLTLPTLHVLRVEHAYEVHEKGQDRQECRFVLRAKLGGQEPAPDLVRTGDAWAASKDRAGFAQQVFRIPPGRSHLEYEVTAECYTTARKSGEVKATQRRMAKGVIQLRGS